MSSYARIKRLSRLMDYCSTTLLLVIPVLLLIVWLNSDLTIKALANLRGDAWRPENLTPMIRLLGFLLSMVPTGVVLYALLQLRRLFRHYQQGQVFTEYAALCLRRFAWALLISGALRPFTGAALSVLLSFNNPPGERVLALSFSSHDISLMFIGGVFILIASIMAEGARLAEENAQIV